MNVFLIWLTVYLVLDFMLIRYYIYFRKNREKFVQHEVQQAAYRFEREHPTKLIFQNPGHMWSVFIGIPIYAVTLYALYKMLFWYPTLLIPEGGYLLTNNSSMIIGLFPLMMLNFVVIIVSGLMIKKPIFAAMSLKMFNESSRDGLWNKALITLIISQVFLFPVLYLGANTYGYYDREGVYYNQFFEIEGDYTRYEDIERIVVGFNKNDDNETYAVSYDIYLSDGLVLDIETNNVIDGMSYEFHKYLEQHYTGTFITEEPTDSDWEYLNDLNEEKREELLYILEGLH